MDPRPSTACPIFSTHKHSALEKLVFLSPCFSTRKFSDPESRPDNDSPPSNKQVETQSNRLYFVRSPSFISINFCANKNVICTRQHPIQCMNTKIPRSRRCIRSFDAVVLACMIVYPTIAVYFRRKFIREMYAADAMTLRDRNSIRL
ncbi:hypothetical protein BDZ45DRAFT_344513 [Acephala macrosclerotiorum]|nr:hypothetical protein BDZ45DRAFT_344513 [Acephala macrosclerotiorum]